MYIKYKQICISQKYFFKMIFSSKNIQLYVKCPTKNWLVTKPRTLACEQRAHCLHKRPVQMLLLCPITSRSRVHTVSSGRAGAPLTHTAIIWLYPLLHMGSLPFADGLNPLSERERERLSFSLRPADQSVTSLPGCIKDHMVVLQLRRSKEKYARKQLWSLTCSNPVY